METGRTDEPQATQRLTVAQAADQLGITEGAVRSRIKRDTLRTTKEGGTVFVLWGDGTSQTNQSPNTDEPTDQPRLVEELRDRVASLERRLDRELERHGGETERLHQIIAGLAQTTAEQARTIRAIEALATEETTEDAETVEEAPESAEPRSDTGGVQAATETPERRSWWRRVFGRRIRRDMESDPSMRFLRRLVKFLREKKHDPDPGGEVIVRRHEVGAVAHGVGLSEEEGWRKFMAQRGDLWRGQPMAPSEERDYTAVRLAWVYGDPS